jgi:carbon-monoxide dehydrogenase medium subunit
MPSTDLVTPNDTEELVAALARATTSSRLLAGGTDLVRDIRRPGVAPDLLIDLSALSKLSFVRLDGEELCVGAMSTFSELQVDPLVRKHAWCLAQAAAQVGSRQIRNIATVGGNIANASACADSAPALLALGASVLTLDGAGRRSSRSLDEVLVGSGTTSLAHDEAITEFRFPALGDAHRASFAKIGTRIAVSVARLSMALIVRFDPAAGVMTDARVGLGAVGAAAFRDPALEQTLEGRPANEETARLFAAECVAAVQRSIPGRYSLPYKQHAARGLAYDAWNALALCLPCEPDWG